MTFNLSEKIFWHGDFREDDSCLSQKNVKEFIKLLKAKYDHSMSWDEFTDMVNNLAGDKLI